MGNLRQFDGTTEVVLYDSAKTMPHAALPPAATMPPATLPHDAMMLSAALPPAAMMSKSAEQFVSTTWDKFEDETPQAIAETRWWHRRGRETFDAVANFVGRFANRFGCV
jgi:hypothetical protein